MIPAVRRVLFIEGAPAPYRVDFWNAFGQRVDLTVWFQMDHEAGRLWKIDGLGRHFTYEFLPGWRVGEDKYINPGILGKLSREPFDAYIMSLNCSPTEILAAYWLRRHHTPFIFKSDGGFPQRTANPAKEWVKHRIFPLADFWMSSGSNCTNYLRYYGARKEGIIDYPFVAPFENGQLQLFAQDELDAFKQCEGLNEIVIFNAGRFIHGKGIDILLEAYRRVVTEKTTLLLIGSGELEGQYRAYIERNKIPNVVIKPFVQRNELIDYYKAADIYAFPTSYDTYGLVVPEAMMFGLPVIATRMAGVAPDLVRPDQNGFLIDAENPEQLAAALALLIESKDLRVRFGKRSREIIAPYTMDAMVESFMSAVEQVRHKKENGPST